MKNFKLFALIFALALISVSTSAQKEIPDSTEVLFDSNGSFTRVFNVDEDARAKMVTINPLVDDVTWRKIVMRLIDLREQQNRPLYFPHEDIEPETQKNLFAIILSNFLEGNIKAYEHQRSVLDPTLLPRFVEEYRLKPDDFYNNRLGGGMDMGGDEENEENYDDEYGDAYDEYGDDYGDEYGEDEESQVENAYAQLPKDKNVRMKNFYSIINALTPGVIKYQIQEIWYFNKTASTFENKIIAIAPVLDRKYLNSLSAENFPDVGGLLFWVPYEKLRPLLQAEFVKTTGRNLSPLTNFDNFFMSRQFYSYIIKDYDVEGRPIDYKLDHDPEAIRQEQQRVEDEILNFEQDLWNY